MSEKPEALRLADELDVASLGIRGCLESLSAAELRRQHFEIERLRRLIAEALKAVWMNYDDDLLDRIEAALKEVPR